MKLSIIIPVFNAERYIEKCLKSIMDNIEETKIEVELIIVNDGSTDRTSELLQKIEYKNAKVFHNENHGVSYSRNFGIQKATGDYIMFVDSDDILKSGWIKIILNSLTQNEEDVIYYSSKIDENMSKEKLLYHIVGYYCCCLAGPYSKIYKRKFIIENDIQFDEGIINGEDMLFNLKCYLKLKTYKTVKQSFYLYREAFGTATKRFDAKFVESDKKYHIILSELFKNTEVREEIKKNIEDYEYTNAVLEILNRISYIETYEKASKEYDFILSKPYADIISKEDIDKKSKFYFKLCQKKRFRLIYKITRIKRKLKQRKYKKETFIEI